MQTRYRKTILPNIDRYKDDIDKYWISKLTGILPNKDTEFCKYITLLYAHA